MLVGILIGAYFAVAAMVFAFFLFFTILGGRESDIWKPFVAAPLWPLLVFPKFQEMVV